MHCAYELRRSETHLDFKVELRLRLVVLLLASQGTNRVRARRARLSSATAQIKINLGNRVGRALLHCLVAAGAAARHIYDLCARTLANCKRAARHHLRRLWERVSSAHRLL